MKKILAVLAATTLSCIAIPAMAEEHIDHDRVEDHRDWVESRRDQRVDYSRRDVFEDRVDRAESIADHNDVVLPSPYDVDPAHVDRIEDRFDRVESRRDQRVILGPRDLFEDRIDRAESVADHTGAAGRLVRPAAPVNRFGPRRAWR